jgi:hypothetical protein
VTIKSIFQALKKVYEDPKADTANVKWRFLKEFYPKKFKLDDFIKQNPASNNFLFIFIDFPSDNDVSLPLKSSKVEKILREFYYQEDELMNLDQYTSINKVVDIYNISENEKYLNDWLEAAIYNSITLRGF